MQKIDLIDRKLLNLVQSKFPLVDQPYQEMGLGLGIGEEEAIQRLGALRKQNVVRQISAIFDTRRLGYTTSLVAMAFEPGKLHKGALKLNKHPGVSHNYAREGSYYNLWFTLAVPPGDSIEATVEGMAKETGALVFRMMPTIRFFKIGVNFDMVEEKGAAYQYYSPDGYNDDHKLKDWNKAVPVSDFDIRAIRELQEDLPMNSRPFDGMAQRLGVTNQELFDIAREFEERVSCAVSAPSFTTGKRASRPTAWASGRSLQTGQRRLARGCLLIRRDPLLRAAHLPRLALYPFHHAPRHIPRRLRGGGQGDFRGDGYIGFPDAVQYSGIQKDPRQILCLEKEPNAPLLSRVFGT